MGLRYRSALPAGDVSTLPSALQDACRIGYSDFKGRDRGSMRAGNDQTFDTRADHFENWLLEKQCPLDRLKGVSPDDVVALIGTYVRYVNLGDSIKGKENLSEKTLVGYMNSVATLYKEATGLVVPLYEPTMPGKKPTLVPYLRDILQQRTAWKEPKQKREPYTYEMFSSLAHYLDRHSKTDPDIFLSAEWAVFDWSATGVHTGSRLGEYGQSKSQKGSPFATVPMNKDAGDWAGTPLAFIHADMTYYDRNMIRCTIQECIADPSLAEYLHVRFRYDKSKKNFTIRKFQQVSGSILCIVKQTLLIHRRAHLPDDYPIGAYQPSGASPKQFALLTGRHMQQVMQFACRLAYPDP